MVCEHRKLLTIELVREVEYCLDHCQSSVVEYMHSAPLVCREKYAAAHHCPSLITCKTPPILSPNAAVAIENLSSGRGIVSAHALAINSHMVVKAFSMSFDQWILVGAALAVAGDKTAELRKSDQKSSVVGD